MTTPNEDNEQGSTIGTSARYRKVIGIIIIVSAIIYAIGIVTGFIPEGRRIDLVTLAVI